MSTRPVSGRTGKVLIGTTEVADVTSWSLTHRSNVTHYASSATAPWRRTCEGVMDVTGEFECKMQDTPQSLVPGDLVTLKLRVGTHQWQGSARLTEVAYEVDLEGAPVGLKTSFQSDGAWSFGPYS